MKKLKLHILIFCFLLVMLSWPDLAFSDVLPVNETIANAIEQEQATNDANIISPQETDFTGSIVNAMTMIADRLKAEQISYVGNWPNEDDFIGSIVAGLASAYEVIKNKDYKTSAELGGDCIVMLGNYYGDEVFAMTRLDRIAVPPYVPLWWKWGMAVQDFYVDLYSWGTNEYISQYAAIDPSVAVFYVAYHVVASSYVDAIDKEVWREALINYLSQVDDDSSYFPVMAMGVATWALAQTGPLDDTLIDSIGTGTAYWNDVKLADLPGLLLSHQVPVNDSDPNQGSFYWRFDHGDGGSGGAVSGYTEDTIFATLGLISAYRANPALDLETAILNAGQALLSGIGNDGKVCEHLSLESLELCVFGGEMLQALGELVAQQSEQAD
jgi:hypothetical protein